MCGEPTTAPRGAHGYKYPPHPKLAVNLSDKLVRPVFKPTSRWTVLALKPVRPGWVREPSQGLISHG
jgi:hypothetical protein